MTDLLNIEINGVRLQVKPGTMVIEAADDAGFVIPRFCYHKKLSIAANCRMCLVDVEKAAKPVPACATPVTEGMKVYTKSVKAIEAQKSVMEFLLINHPLDCPICDQGGECELQDIAMGFGKDASRFRETKRVVREKYLGPLISTDMTRCIHCTRCVRFGREIAGVMELGAPGRGEHMAIETYMESAVGSELSGNVIDLCPVGALTSKPYRYTGRPWENTAATAISPHDCVGSNLKVEVRRNQVMRVLPHENEAINEVWLADRDRYSYTGLHTADRLQQPMIKQGETWREVDWETALTYASEGMRRVIASHGAAQLGALSNPNATLEEFYLLQKLVRGLGSHNIDHRLRQLDFSDQAHAPVYPHLGQSIAALEELQAGLLIGAYPRKDQPLINHRLRKAAKRGAKISAVNTIDYDVNFTLTNTVVTHPFDMPLHLAAIAKVLAEQTGKTPPAAVQTLLAAAKVEELHRQIATQLTQAERSTVLIGTQALAQPNLAVLRNLANVIADLSNSSLGYLPEGANAAGAWLAGAVPHRTTAGRTVPAAGKSALQMLDTSCKALVLWNVEPEYDCADPATAMTALQAAEFVVALTPFVTDTMRGYADVILPISPFAETSGTFVNVEGRWQSFTASVKSLAESRPGWKVLRVLGNFFKLDGFEYLSSEEVRSEIDTLTVGIIPQTRSEVQAPSNTPQRPSLLRIGHVPIYAVDNLVRRAQPLQQSNDALQAMVAMNAHTADKLGVRHATQVRVSQAGQSVTLPLYIEASVADDCAVIPAGVVGSERLGTGYGSIDVKAV
ncbi:MAG: NADH-quinone oxidoreductase subunit G [Gammaproteobacteria bacterium]|nr:NADH-quinone oxidoreductase subunit G [Gammaproteobacteria bacterium]